MINLVQVNFTRFIVPILLIFSCERLDITNQSSVNSADEKSTRLSGLWFGEIEGGRPYFNINPRVVIELLQFDSLIQGVLRTSDGSFKNDSLQNGIFLDPEIKFDARQTNYYTGSIISFSGFITHDTVHGIWYSTQTDSGKWFAMKQQKNTVY